MDVTESTKDGLHLNKRITPAVILGQSVCGRRKVSRDRRCWSWEPGRTKLLGIIHAQCPKATDSIHSECGFQYKMKWANFSQKKSFFRTETLDEANQLTGEINLECEHRILSTYQRSWEDLGCDLLVFHFLLHLQVVPVDIEVNNYCNEL